MHTKNKTEIEAIQTAIMYSDASIAIYASKDINYIDVEIYRRQEGHGTTSYCQFSIPPEKFKEWLKQLNTLV